MRCNRCGAKARCIGKEPKYCYTDIVGIRRKYECKKCGAIFNTVEEIEHDYGGYLDGPVIFNGER